METERGRRTYRQTYILTEDAGRQDSSKGRREKQIINAVSKT